MVNNDLQPAVIFQEFQLQLRNSIKTTEEKKKKRQGKGPKVCRTDLSHNALQHFERLPLLLTSLIGWSLHKTSSLTAKAINECMLVHLDTAQCTTHQSELVH